MQSGIVSDAVADAVANGGTVAGAITCPDVRADAFAIPGTNHVADRRAYAGAHTETHGHANPGPYAHSNSVAH